MKNRTCCLCLALLFLNNWLAAQISADCANAIPICNDTPVNGGTYGYGTDDFNGGGKSGCLEKTVTGAIESNSAWYRFRTGASGQLGFHIGFDKAEDWDFALYRASDCQMRGDPVRCNFFDNSDQEASMGVGDPPHEAQGSVLYEPWMQVSEGEDYYLLINNFSNTNSGFSIRFTGQIFETNPNDALDCSIISNLLGPPISACENDTVVLDATMPGALGYRWYLDTGSGFELIGDASEATFGPLESGMYRVEVITAGMGHTVSDVQVAFSQAPQSFEVSDEVLCGDSTFFDLSVKGTEVIGPQDAEGITVSYHRTYEDAWHGADPLPLHYPLISGSATIHLRTASSSNPNCYDVSESFELTVLPAYTGDFPGEVFACEDQAEVTIGPADAEAGFTYSWDTGQHSPGITVSQAGIYTLTVTNGPCEFTRTVRVIISSAPRIADIVIGDLKENNTVEILPATDGAFEYRLDDGEFQSSNRFTGVPPGMHTVWISDSRGCGQVSEIITVVGFPRFFTPNGDGHNDYWHIQGIDTLREPEVDIFDRFGRLVKHLERDSMGWDGTYKGVELPSSDYWFKLFHTASDGQRMQARYIENHFSLTR